MPRSARRQRSWARWFLPTGWSASPRRPRPEPVDTVHRTACVDHGGPVGSGPIAHVPTGCPSSDSPAPSVPPTRRGRRDRRPGVRIGPPSAHEKWCVFDDEERVEPVQGDRVDSLVAESGEFAAYASYPQAGFSVAKRTIRARTPAGMAARPRVRGGPAAADELPMPAQIVAG